jgi:hypothetical protein
LIAENDIAKSGKYFSILSFTMNTNHTPKQPAQQARQKKPAVQAGHV